MLRISCIFFILLLGFYTGAQLGKIAPAVNLLQQEYGYSLTFIGWLTSLIGFFVAIAAVPAGIMIERFGIKRSLYLGSVILFAGTILLGISENPAFGLGARIVEAAGYLIVVIAAPALLNEITSEKYKSAALALWGGFVPIGFTLANLQADILLERIELSGFLLSMGVGFGFLALLVFGSLKKLRIESPIAVQLKPTLIFSDLPKSAFIIALSFGLYVGLSICFFTFLPKYLSSLDTPVLLSAGMIALAVPIGNILTGLLLAGGFFKNTKILAVFGFTVSCICVLLVFNVENPTIILIAALLHAFSGGLIASALFASIPHILPKGASSALLIGIIAQAGGLATVGGPPLAGFIIEKFGWQGLGILLSILASIGISLMINRNIPNFSIKGNEAS